MRKFVYLFELDSVRKTDDEIIFAFNTLYDEIVENGNIVVLTYNQLVDSRAFFSLLDDDRYCNGLINMFEKGILRISQYGKMRTITQYFIESLEGDSNNFKFSAIPVRSDQKRLRALIKRSLIYSDLSEISEYLNGGCRSDREVWELFDEGKDDDFLYTSKDIRDLRNKLTSIKRMLHVVLQLSTIDGIYISPKDTDCYKNCNLMRFIKILEGQSKENVYNKELWDKAIALVRSLECYGSNNRSEYYKCLIKRSENDRSNVDVYRYAEAIIGVCTNYTYELSISNISKHYDVNEILGDNESCPSFFEDFQKRLAQNWNDGKDKDRRYLVKDTNNFAKFDRFDEIPDFLRAARFVPTPDTELYASGADVPSYEKGLRIQRKKMSIYYTKMVLSKLAGLLVGVCVIFFLNIIFNLIESFATGGLGDILSWRSFAGFILETLLFLFLTEIITTLVSKKFPKVISLSDAIGGLVKVVGDSIHVLFRKPQTYMSCEYETDIAAPYDRQKPILWTESKEIKDYKKLTKDNPDLFRKSEIYDIADVGDADEVCRLIKWEEKNDKKIGVLYKSRFNTLVVDPIRKGDGDYFLYERIIPSSGKNGVVIIPRYKDKFLLLEQYRHALRGKQLCFPRGFGEKGLSDKENCYKELHEELGGLVLSEAVRIGSVVPDSGLSSGKATVFIADISEYTKLSEEGIDNVLELSFEEMNNCIRSGKIDDGFTLSAWAMYCNNN